MSGAALYRDFLSDRAAAETKAEPGADAEEMRLARVRGKARAAGFAEGVESAEAAFDHDLRTRLDAVSAGLSSHAAERVATDQAAIDATRRIVMQTLSAFLPDLSHAALPGHAAEAVAAALNAELDGRIVVKARPDRLQDIEAALNVRDERVVFEADEAIDGTAARICWRGGFDQIDAAAAIAKGLEILNERLTAARPRKDEDMTP